MPIGEPAMVTTIGPSRRTRSPAPPSSAGDDRICVGLTLLTTFGSRPSAILPAWRKGDKAMHDINPLSTTMHLKELDRRAAPTLRPMRPRGEHSIRVFAYAMSAAAIVLHALAVVSARIARTRDERARERGHHVVRSAHLEQSTQPMSR
jgi:hypothetical protein